MSDKQILGLWLKAQRDYSCQPIYLSFARSLLAAREDQQGERWNRRTPTEITEILADGSIRGKMPLTYRRNLGSGGYGD